MSWKLRITGICLTLLVLVGVPFTLIQWKNVNLLHDPLGQVHYATVAGLPMTKLFGGWYAQYPTSEGTFEIVCKSRQQIKQGYVTGYGGVTLKVGPNCSAEWSN